MVLHNLLKRNQEVSLNPKGFSAVYVGEMVGDPDNLLKSTMFSRISVEL